jgi:hypothetical protein
MPGNPVPVTQGCSDESTWNVKGLSMFNDIMHIVIIFYLQASDQYLLEGLKRLCEMCIAQSLSVEELAPTFELSEAFSAPQVGS